MPDDEIVTRPTKGTPVQPADPEEVEAVTGRPNDEAPENSTFAERAKQRAASEKRIASSENKAVRKASAKKA